MKFTALGGGAVRQEKCSALCSLTLPQSQCGEKNLLQFSIALGEFEANITKALTDVLIIYGRTPDAYLMVAMTSLARWTTWAGMPALTIASTASLFSLLPAHTSTFTQKITDRTTVVSVLYLSI